MPRFELGDSVHANVLALRIALGSTTRPLSMADMAQLLNQQDGRKRASSTIQKWEAGTEPDLQSIRIMAQMAGVSFEEFALGRGEGAATPQRRPAMPSPGGIPVPRGGSVPRHHERKKGA